MTAISRLFSYRSSLTALGLLLATPACILDGPPTSPPAGIDGALDEGGCAPEECGTNGVILADRRFSPLDLRDGDNGRGLLFTGFVDRDGLEWALQVEEGQWVARSWNDGSVRLRGQQLVGGALLVTRTTGTGETRHVRLQLHDLVALPHFSDRAGGMPAYRMTQAPEDRPDDQRSLCPDDQRVVLVVGEQYDARTLDIGTAADDHWVELACQEHLLGKAKRMSYDPAIPVGDRQHTSTHQRRATLAMLAADYCGDGRRFTTPGTPIQWRNRGDWMTVGTPAEGEARLEAGWTSDGALCLGTPRRADLYPKAAIEHACGRTLPTCTPELLRAAEWVTWVP